MKPSESASVRFGFDGWQNVDTVSMTRTTLWRDGQQDWWSVHIDVPEDAHELDFSFTDGESWENNDGHNFASAVKTLAVRAIEHEEVCEHASGAYVVREPRILFICDRHLKKVLKDVYQCGMSTCTHSRKCACTFGSSTYAGQFFFMRGQLKNSLLSFENGNTADHQRN